MIGLTYCIFIPQIQNSKYESRKSQNVQRKGVLYKMFILNLHFEEVGFRLILNEEGFGVAWREEVPDLGQVMAIA